MADTDQEPEFHVPSPIDPAESIAIAELVFPEMRFEVLEDCVRCGHPAALHDPDCKCRCDCQGYLQLGRKNADWDF